MPTDISKLSKEDVARMIDYAILAPDWQDKHQLAGCEDVRKYKFAAYYVLPHWTPLIVHEIGDFCRENKVLIGTGISFPYGSATTTAKLAEAEDQIHIGCTVLDMVANIAWLKDGKYDLYAAECNRFVKLCHDAGLIAKVIIKVGYLTNEETKIATKIVAEFRRGLCQNSDRSRPKRPSQLQRCPDHLGHLSGNGHSLQTQSFGGG